MLNILNLFPFILLSCFRMQLQRLTTVEITVRAAALNDSIVTAAVVRHYTPLLHVQALHITELRAERESILSARRGNRVEELSLN